MKIILAIFLCVILLTGCTENTEPEIFSTIATAETTTAEVTTTVTKVKDPPVIAEYESGLPAMKTISRLYKEQYDRDPDSPLGLSKYAFFDADGDYCQEIVLVMPYEQGWALHIINEDGTSETCPIDGSEDVTELEGNLRVDADGEGPGALVVFLRLNGGNSAADSDFYRIDGGRLVLYSEYDVLEFSQEDLHSFAGYCRHSPESFEEMASEQFSLTLLDRVQAYADDVRGVLYDVTGDNFPELIVTGFEYITASVVISDMSRGYPVELCTCTTGSDDKVYLCRDGGNYFILTSYSVSYFTLGYCADRYDLYRDGAVWKRIGYAYEYYQTTEDDWKFYNSEFEFEGSDAGRLGYYEDTDSRVGKLFDSAFEEYLSRCEVVAQLPVWHDPATAVQSGLAEYPRESALPPMPEEEDVPLVEICDRIKYPIDTDYLSLDYSDLPEDFDSDILNSFENLDDVEFYGYGDGTKKLVIKPSEWCGRITYLSVDPDYFEPEGGWGCFENVTYLIIDGKPESLDFVKDMPNIEIVWLPSWNGALDKEYLTPLTELPSLSVVIGYTNDFPDDDEWSEICSMFDKQVRCFLP